MNEVTLRLLLDEARRGGLALWLGADLPRTLTGLPSRQDLARTLAMHFGLVEGQATPGLFTVAQQAGRIHFRDVIQLLAEQLNTVGRAPQAVELLCAQLPVDLLITTCYDDRLEKAFQANRRALHTLVSEADVGLHRRNSTTLVKLYGDLRQPDSLTITEDNLYDLQRQKPGVVALVQQAMQGTLLLLGHDLHSPDFLLLWREVLQRLGRFAPVAYAAVTEGMTAADQQLWRERNIELLAPSALQILQTLALHLPQPGNTLEPPGQRDRSTLSETADHANRKAEILANLRKVLAHLYPDDASLRRVVTDAGIDLSLVLLNSTPINNWYSVLTEAEKTERVAALLGVIEDEYQNNQELQSACNRYRQLYVLVDNLVV